ncbi:thioredoxin family protein [Amycolatopsis jejuensis]|uniref:thioredoxin family protein n=1 Tax=Amycolatopsis jejuensis TaxID=330084 RepID=UPI000527DEB4|nr:thioredoxin domain-containing protein [Amycolatopsis jejuensis]
MSEHTIPATDADFDELVLKSAKPVLVDFWGVHCGFCRPLAVQLELLGQSTPEITVVKVDVAEAPETAAKYDVFALPTMLLFIGGEVVDTVTVRKHDKLREAVGKHVALAS